MSVAPAIDISGLTRRYRGRGPHGKAATVTAVDDVSLQVRPGELVVLLGPSGCGKTTLLRSVAGLDMPDAGEIVIGGRRVFSRADRIEVPPEARRIGMMFQSYALWPHMTVAQNVRYPRLPAKDAARLAADVDAMLERLGVGGLGHRYPGELSGGQQQRVALARALIASPALILFDEPLSNVDAKVRRRLRAELREVKARTGFAGLYVTHDQEEAMELADTLVVMEAGRIRQGAAPRVVYDEPASLYVAEFVGEFNHWAARVEQTTAAGIVTVDSALGRFDAPTAGAAATGTTGWIGIRPEHVGIAPRDAPAGAAPGAHRRAATVADVIHLGPRVECRAEIDRTPVIAWLSAGDAGRLGLAAGQAVDVVMPREHLRWLAN